MVDHRADTQAETAIRALRAIDGLLARSTRAAPTTMPMLPPLVTDDDVQPTPSRPVSLAPTPGGHLWPRTRTSAGVVRVKRQNVAGSVHEIVAGRGP